MSARLAARHLLPLRRGGVAQRSARGRDAGTTDTPRALVEPPVGQFRTTHNEPQLLLFLTPLAHGFTMPAGCDSYSGPKVPSSALALGHACIPRSRRIHP